MITTLGTLAGGAIEFLCAALLLAVDEKESSGVLNDTKQVAFCVIGSIIGAFIAIAVFPPQHDTEVRTMQRVFFKFGASMGCGILLGPLLIEWQEWNVSYAKVMGISGIVSIFAVGILHPVAPRFELVTMWLLDWLFPKSKEDPRFAAFMQPMATKSARKSLVKPVVEPTEPMQS
jgi:hypothetical protein